MKANMVLNENPAENSKFPGNCTKNLVCLESARFPFDEIKNANRKSYADS